jgi:chaperonin GroEL
MPHKQFLFLRGTTACAGAVRVTLGPRSRCVLIEGKWGRPIVCNDGVTIEVPEPKKEPAAEPLG